MQYYRVRGHIIHLPSVRHIKRSELAKILVYYHGIEEAEVIEFKNYESADQEMECLWRALNNMKEIR